MTDETAHVNGLKAPLASTHRLAQAACQWAAVLDRLEDYLQRALLIARKDALFEAHTRRWEIRWRFEDRW